MENEKIERLHDARNVPRKKLPSIVVDGAVRKIVGGSQERILSMRACGRYKTTMRDRVEKVRNKRSDRGEMG